MTKVPGSEDSLYFASPAAKVALKAYEPDFCVSLRLTAAWPFASVVAVAVWAPRAKLTFLPATGWPYSSTRSAASKIGRASCRERGEMSRVSGSVDKRICEEHE